MFWLDIAIIAIIALSVMTGLFRGFVKELISVSVWILAIWMSINFSHKLDPWLSPYIHQDAMRSGAAFLLILFTTLLLGGVVNALLSFILKRTGLSGTDRLLGMGFGFIRGVFIVSIIIVGMRMTNMPEDDYRQQSNFYVKFDPLVNSIASYVPSFISKVKTLDVNESMPTRIVADL